MAVFDKKIFKKVSLDDTEALTITIENAQNVSGHTEYVIKVQRGPNPDKSWLICKRYSDFVTLHNMIQGSGANVVLPPKKLIGNMDRNFIAQRQLELQNYLTAVLSNPFLASTLSVKKFLDPYNYATSLQELALQNVSMALRSEVNLELVKSAPEIGWRLRKHYFIVKSKLTPKSEMLLQWIEYGPDKCLEDKELQNIFKCLVALEHPHIEKLHFAHCGVNGCFTVRQLYPNGTLRDLIYRTKPKTSFIKKYGNPKHSQPLSISDVSIYGRQIIETLIFLQEKGIPHGHLHSGNILIVDNNIKLLDIENTILGLPAFYRPFFVQYKKINVMERVDVYSLGHTLFEMTFGYALHEPVCDKIPSSCPSSLCSVLETILSSHNCKSGLPTLQELLQHPFFSMSYNSNFSRINFKLNSSIRESLKAATKLTEKRLQDEQKLIRRRKKLTKVQGLLTSDESLVNSGKKPKKLGKGSNKKQMEMLLEEKSPRSNSLTSNSTAASADTTTPPLISYKIPTLESVKPSSGDSNRSALLDSICAFDKSALRHRSTPVNGSACS